MPPVYTAGQNINVDSSNVISCTLVPAVYTGGANINIDGSNVISCILQPFTVALDGTSHTPSNIKLNNFITSVDGSEVTIEDQGMTVAIYNGYGIGVAGNALGFWTISNTPAPAYQCIESDGTTTTYQPDQVTNLVFNNFTKTFSQNTLSLTPEVPAPLVTEDGISISRPVSYTHLTLPTILLV